MYCKKMPQYVRSVAVGSGGSAHATAACRGRYIHGSSRAGRHAPCVRDARWHHLRRCMKFGDRRARLSRTTVAGCSTRGGSDNDPIGAAVIREQ